MEVSIVRGYPHSWMVYFMENTINMNDLRVPYFRKPHIYIYISPFLERWDHQWRYTKNSQLNLIHSWFHTSYQFIYAKNWCFFRNHGVLSLFSNQSAASISVLCPVPALRSHATVLQMASAISPPAEMGASLHRSTAWAAGSVGSGVMVTVRVKILGKGTTTLW